MRQGYQGVVVAAPVTVPYARYSIRAAHWWLARALDSLVAQLFAHKTLEHQIFAKTAPQKAREEFRIWRVAHHRELFDVLMGKAGIDPETAVLAHLRAGFDDPERFSSLTIRHPGEQPPAG